jgi:hypothetical protein
MITMLTMSLAATTTGIGAPQFDESSTLVLKVANMLLIALAIVVLWRNAFGKKTSETFVSPSPLSVKAHEEFVTMREFKEIKARTIGVEKEVQAIKQSIHDTELRLLEAGHHREEKLMARIDTLVPELAKALDRTEQRRRGTA